MVGVGRIILPLGSAIALVAIAGTIQAQNTTVPWPLLATPRSPSFGTKDYEITTISATSFVPETDIHYVTTPELGRATQTNTDVHSYANLDVPGGTIIDYIGVNSSTDTDGVIGVALWRRFSGGSKELLMGSSLPAHLSWGTDDVGPLGIQIISHSGQELVIDVENASSPNEQFFGWVEVVWHRTVSLPPVTATFSDVPTSSPQFRFVQALYAAGITAGCGGGNFCPNDPVTRGQMAVFLATALGLHWPG